MGDSERRGNEEEKEVYLAKEQDENQWEVKEKDDEGEMLVSRRALSRVKEEQRDNIFHSRCTV